VVRVSEPRETIVVALTRTRITEFEASEDTAAIAKALANVPFADSSENRTLVIGDTELTVSGSVYNAVLDVLNRIAHQDAVIIGSTDSLLTTSQAAELAGVSRPFLCQLVDRGELDAEYIGTHRKIRLDDLTAYLERRRSRRREALDDASRVSRAAGQYADDF
jgi:excisionase family DNA binding protein